MDLRLEFSQEMLLKALLAKENENNDILNLLLQSADLTESGIKNIQNGIESVKEDTAKINSKLDLVLEKLDKLETEFTDLKEESRDIDQKLILLSGKLDKIEKAVDDTELEDYYALCQSLYNNWDELEELTRRLIPVAEYLFSKLQKYKKPDYSPVILELCRAIENEFLLKIFSKYTMDVIRRKGTKLDMFLATDRSAYALRDKTSAFVKAINKSSKTRHPEYTLGQMNMIMSILNEPNTVSESPLLQDFKAYLEIETVAKDLLSIQYIRKINDLVDRYRNPAAHPGSMGLDQAKKCKEIMPDRIDYLMDCVCTN